MIYRSLGKSGLKVSQFGLGTLNFGARVWGIDEKSSIDLVHAYLDAGGNHIDSSNMYSAGESERIIGRAIKERRHEVILASKCGVPVGPEPNRRGCSRYHIIEQVEQSLQRLNVDYIDLFYLHLFDPSTPFEESIRAISDLVRDGKIRYFGLSNYTGWQIAEFAGFARADSMLEPVIAVQNEYSMIFRGCEYEVVPACRYHNIGIVCYSPLGGGLLSGVYDAHTGAADRSERYVCGEIIEKKFRNVYLTERNLAIYRKADHFAQELHTSVATLATAWLLHRPGVSCILLGPKTLDHLIAGLAAARLDIPAAMIEHLDTASLPEMPYPYDNQNRIIPEFFGAIERDRDCIEIKPSLLPDFLKKAHQIAPEQ